MAKLRVRYIAIDPYYSTHEQTFIGATLDDCGEQQFEYEQWLGREHPAGIKCIFKTEILEEKP